MLNTGIRSKNAKNFRKCVNKEGRSITCYNTSSPANLFRPHPSTHCMSFYKNIIPSLINRTALRYQYNHFTTPLQTLYNYQNNLQHASRRSRNHIGGWRQNRAMEQQASWQEAWRYLWFHCTSSLMNFPSRIFRILHFTDLRQGRTSKGDSHHPEGIYRHQGFQPREVSTFCWICRWVSCWLNQIEHSLEGRWNCFSCKSPID